MSNPQNTYESPESSSPIVTRAVAAGLQNLYCNTYEFAAWQQFALRLLGRLPQNAARFAISRFESFNGLKADRVANLNIEMLIAERLQDYKKVSGPFPCITIGSALGGASAHLSLATGGPFLPQAFVLTLRGGAQDGDIQTYYHQSAALAKTLVDNNPNILTIQHYDPIHDEWMTRFVNHLRVKVLDLPPAYARYIERNLIPGGTVCYLDCSAKWLRYRVGPQSVFQVGGWGDISAQEFIGGSSKIEDYCRQIGLKTKLWMLPDFPLEEGPESEWGSEPGLGIALKEFCEHKGFQFVPIRLSEPHDFSRLAFYAQQHLLAKESVQPAGVVIGMFTQFDPTAVNRAGLLPLWLVFNTWDSLRFLQSMRSAFPANKPVFFSPLATFTHTPDLVPWQEWQEILHGLDWHNIGARPSHYPADALALTNWAEPLRTWSDQHANPIHTTLSAEELLQAVAEWTS